MIINKCEHEGKFRENPATGHNHSYYSLSDSPQSPREYVARCKELGFKSAALNDHGTLLGMHPFMDACKEFGINGIPGIEAYSKICPEVAEILKDYKEFVSGRTHLILNPKNYHGYQLISYAARDASQYVETLAKLKYPITYPEIIEKYFMGSDDVFATSACVQGAVAYILLTNKRIEKKREKEEAVCKANIEQYNQYMSSVQELNALSEILKETKKERTSLIKYAKPSHEEKIKKLQDKIAISKEGSKSLEKAKAGYEQAILQKKEAEEKLPGIEKKVEQLEMEKVKLKEQTACLKKSADKYLKAAKKMDQYPYVSEELLYKCAKIQLDYYKKVFKTFFIELQYHGEENEAYVMPILLKLADETNTPIIAANDAHVSKQDEDDFEARRIIRYNYFEKAQTTDDVDRELYVKTDWELIDALSMVVPKNRAEEAVMNTDIFNHCHVILPDEEHYPSVKTDKSFDELLEEKRLQMIEDGEWDDKYEQRLRHEMKTIHNMGYVDYHMVVMDFCQESRKLGVIPKSMLDKMPDDFNEIHQWIQDMGFKTGVGVGPGRGSAAGSLVCYMLGITNVNPIKYNLLFERFLNPERVSMPDIDSDIKTSLRPTIIKYLQWKYGDRAVCSIATETTYAARGAVLMAGRERASQLYSHLPKPEAKSLCQQYLYDVTNKVSAVVPEKPGTKLGDCDKEFNSTFADNEEAQIVWKHAKLLEGKICGTGVHAGGVIISDNDNVNDYVALSWNDDRQVWAAQCDMIKAEEIGLLKMDLLGLNTLDVISDTLHYIQKYRNIEIDINKVPFEKEVFDAIYATGNTNSVFQFESAGMKAMLKEFGPTCIEDIIMLVACYRPGPMQYLEKIIAIKNGRQELTYKTPALESILCETYGSTVYQEQVMQIFQKLAGYSLGAADMVRRAMSKKKMEKLAIEREAFVHGDAKRNIPGCVSNGIPEAVANELFDEMMDFAKYAFNKSHAASYAIVSYQTAWLKYHYPAEFLCAMFNNKNLDNYAPLYADCKLYGIRMLPPDINKSNFEFVLEDNDIRYGFSGIKGLGTECKPLIDELCKNRAERFYTSIQDVLLRNLSETQTATGLTKANIFNDKTINTLINSGAFDRMHDNRESLTEAVNAISITACKNREDAFASTEKQINDMEIPDLPRDIAYNVSCEMECLKTILSKNPLDEYKSDSFYNCDSIDSLSKGYADIFGFVTGIEKKRSAKGNDMLIITLQGKTGSCTVLAMKSLYLQYVGKIQELEYSVIKVGGMVNENGSIFANSITKMQNISISSYFLDLDTEKVTRFAMNLKQQQKERTVDTTVRFWYSLNKRTGELIKKNSPVIYKSKFSEDEIEQMYQNGLKISQENV